MEGVVKCGVYIVIILDKIFVLLFIYLFIDKGIEIFLKDWDSFKKK